MQATHEALFAAACEHRRRRPAALPAAALLLATFVSGCAAMTNPVADGLPVRHVAPELLAKSMEGERTIPLTLLEQPPPAVYQLAPGDVLGVTIEGVLGAITGQATAISLTQAKDQPRFPPYIGYPIPVREDGTLSLPYLDPIAVQGLTVTQAEDKVRNSYVTKQILPAARAKVLISLLHRRSYHVLVLRQESSNVTLGSQGEISGGKRGTGHAVDLIAYENDVLHALAETGGLPGLDACNQVVIFRGCFRGQHDRALALEKLKALPADVQDLSAAGLGTQIIKIPLRARPGEEPPLRPEDILLQTGDVVFIEARDDDVFYTGGLLPAGEFVLPRDRDLDVLQAISRVKGPLINGAFSTNNLSGTLIAPGIGNPSPSLLTILRPTPGGGQVPIRVDLNRALRDPRERILVHAGDTLILQEMPSEAMTRYFTQTFFNFSLAWQVIHERFATGVVDISAPERLPARIGVVGPTR